MNPSPAASDSSAEKETLGQKQGTLPKEAITVRGPIRLCAVLTLAKFWLRTFVREERSPKPDRLAEFGDLKAAREMCTVSPELGNNLAEALEYDKNPAEAELIFRQALGDYRTLANRFPNDIDYQWSLAMVLTNIAAVADQRGRAKQKRLTSSKRPRRSSSTSPPRWARMKISRGTDRRTCRYAS